MRRLLELLEAAAPRAGDGIWRLASYCFKDCAAVRLSCTQWKAIHDALKRGARLREETTDERAVEILVRRCPALTELDFSGEHRF